MMAVACSSSPNMKRRFFHNNMKIRHHCMTASCMLHVTVSHTVQVVRHVTANRPTRKSEFDYERTSY